MELSTILSQFGWQISTVVIILCGFIKIPKIEINLWSILGNAIGRAINKPVIDKLSTLEDKVDSIDRKYTELDNKLDEHIVTSKEDRVQAARNRILRFNDEILAGQEHTKEHYDDLLKVIDEYKDYCEKHPEFPNSRCVFAVENIEEEYKERLKNNSFVKIERLAVVKKEDNL